ncbi:Transmembrane 9 superfamily member 5 [Spatholobus suberectus]|nr:Transmembrane 9 superfamily member 5 [Spatholobus suberectus]
MAPHHHILLLLLCATLQSSSASPSDHLYDVGDVVPLFVNKVGPLNNPSETYEYYDLPFCTPDPIVRKKESLGEVLNGDRLSNALYEFKFRQEKIGETLCQKKLTIDQVAILKQAINRDFYFQFYLDDLPFWGFIGKLEEDGWTPGGGGPSYYLFTHVQFDILYNGNRIIQVNAFGDPNRAVDITEDVGVDVNFTYSVIWNATKVRFENRMDRYSRASLMPVHRQVHWFSFVNSIVIILLLIGLLALLYMRHLSSDLKKYSNANEEDKEVGWKSLHGDVFRPPPSSSILFAVVGTGTQLLILLCVLLFLALIGTLYPYNRGGLLNWLVLLYALSSVFAGYTAASFHGQFAENGWERSVSLAGILYTGPVFVAASILNIVAISYRATTGLPLGSIIVILVLFTFLAIPLLAFGGVIGYRFRSKFQSPSATTKRHPRDIQQLAWYRRTPFLMFIGGLVPFSAIVLQLHQVYASMWGYKIYTLPSILFATFIPVIVIIALVSIGLTYIQLSVEDHEWWWRSVLCGGSTAIFMFGYCIYFYVRSNMSGFLQLSFFIGYNACLCYAFFLIFGAISFRVSLLFVRLIYHDVKRE